MKQKQITTKSKINQSPLHQFSDYEELEENRHKQIVLLAQKELGSNLHTIISFGSENTGDFISGLSDLDFLFLLDKINSKILKKIKKLRTKISIKFRCDVDIKPFTLTEFKAAISGKGTFEFFNGWGLSMINSGEQKCLYTSDTKIFDYKIPRSRIQKDSLERAHYYITKLRKIFGSNIDFIVRGESQKILSDKQQLKIITSSIKGVLMFCLAYKSVLVFKTTKVITHSELVFGDIQVIKEAFEAREKVIFDYDILTKAYNKVEEIYKETLAT